MEKREENRVSLSLSLRRGRSGSDPNRSGCCSCFRLQSSIRGGRDRGARGVRRVPPPQEPKKVLVRVEEDRVDDEGAGLFFEIFKFSFLSFLSFFEFFPLLLLLLLCRLRFFVLVKKQIPAPNSPASKRARSRARRPLSPPSEPPSPPEGEELLLLLPPPSPLSSLLSSLNYFPLLFLPRGASRPAPAS